jgi:2-amino-4-hydroxy-6-hydroxymethyldihydropteridine diphosphokinase
MIKHTAYIGLGSNLGNSREKLVAALAALNEHASIETVQPSSFYQTRPLTGGHTDAEQPIYLNAVARIHTVLSAHGLFDLLQEIEQQLGRERQQVWGPRTIDLDLLLYDDAIIKEPDLQVPHSQMHLRSFVLKGLCELAPNQMHPVLGRSISKLAARLNGQNYWMDPEKPQLISIAGNIGVGKTTLAAGLAERLNAMFITEKYDENPYLADVYDGHTELALDSELFFLSSGASQLTKSRLKPGQYYLSDYVFDKARIYASAWLDGVDFQKYMKYYDSVKEGVSEPVLVIYLYDTLENCMERIHRRNRPYEQQIEPSFLEHLADGYDTLYTDYTDCPLIRLRADECHDSEQVDRIADEVRHYIRSEQKERVGKRI